jgi:peptidoglycan hydrolase CwlO-like protein
VIDTLKLSRDLVEASMPQKQAEAVATAIVDVVSNGDLVTKDYFSAETQKLKSEIQNEIQTLKGDIQKINTEVKVDIQKVKTEMIVWVAGAVFFGDLAVALAFWIHR